MFWFLEVDQRKMKNAVFRCLFNTSVPSMWKEEVFEEFTGVCCLHSCRFVFVVLRCCCCLYSSYFGKKNRCGKDMRSELKSDVLTKWRIQVVICCCHDVVMLSMFSRVVVKKKLVWSCGDVILVTVFGKEKRMSLSWCWGVCTKCLEQIRWE